MLNTERLREIVQFLRISHQDANAGTAEYLHNRILGTLVALRMGLESAEPDECRRLVDSAIAATRSLEAGLRLPELDFGLASAIEYQAKAFTRRTNISCAADVREEHLPGESMVAAGVLGIIHELLWAVEPQGTATQAFLTSGIEESHHVVEFRTCNAAPSVSFSADGPWPVYLELLAAEIGGSITLSGGRDPGASVRLLIPFERQGQP